MAKKLSKGEKLDLILEEIAKIRSALEALGKRQPGRAGKKPRRGGAPRRPSPARAAAA